MNKDAKRIQKSDRKMVAKLDYKDIKHPVSKRDLKQKISFASTCLDTKIMEYI